MDISTIDFEGLIRDLYVRVLQPGDLAIDCVRIRAATRCPNDSATPAGARCNVWLALAQRMRRAPDISRPGRALRRSKAIAGVIG
jgi:hypothetical protein